MIEDEFINRFWLDVKNSLLRIEGWRWVRLLQAQVALTCGR